jgi:hypothetical protein
MHNSIPERTMISSNTSSSWARHLFGSPHEQRSSEITNKEEALALLDQFPSQSIIWDRMHRDLRFDHEIAFKSFKNGCLPSNIQDWPRELQSDRKFWRSLLQSGLWKDSLPAEILDDLEFIRSIPKWNSEEQIRRIFNHHVDLPNDPSIWLVIVDSNVVSVDFWIEFAHDTTILEDKDIMLDAVRHDYSIYDVLCAPLNQDEDIVTAALNQSADALMYIPAFVQRQYPNLVANSIRNWTTSVPSRREQLPDGYRNFYLESQPNRHPDVHSALWIEYVGAELWTNRDVALAWASIGGNYRESFLGRFDSDEDLFLLIAQNNLSQFLNASNVLRSNKGFMRKAVELNGAIILDAEGDLQHDLDLAMIAFSNTDNLLEAFDPFYDQEFLNNVWQLISGKLQEHAIFELIMFATFISPRASLNLGNPSVCPFTLLNQGRETTKTYLQLLKAYLGVPRGNELHQLRQAKQNLRRR